MIKFLNSVLENVGLKIEKKQTEAYDIQHIEDEKFQKIWQKCQPYTMTSAARMYSLYNAVQYVVNNNIPGDFVECGVWRGGSCMLMAETLLALGDTSRNIYLLDTFEGMPAPQDEDKNLFGQSAASLMTREEKSVQSSVWCYADLNDVQNNMGKTGYPPNRLNYIPGKVEDTLPDQLHTQTIALLRLDTDWYASTLHELIHLYPLLSSDGVIIVDDYGHWKGCQKAVDEYFSGKKILFNRVDYTGIIGVKPATT